MGMKQEFKGKDVDDAITSASDKLGVPREELNIEILSTGSSGIFGLCRRQAVIRVSKKPSQIESVETQKWVASEIKCAEEEPLQTTPVTAKVLETAPDQLPSEEQASHSSRERKERKTSVQRPSETVSPVTPDILLQIRHDLDQLLILMGFPSEIEAKENKGKALIKISGDHVADLISKDGQALDSIQYLMRKIIGKKFPQRIMFSIDAGEFREKRKTELQELALKLAQEVKETEKTKTIPPLNPAERRVVHLVLQEDKTIRSRSVGEGLFKKILIYLPGKGRMRKKTPRRKAKTDKLTIPE